MLLTQIAVASDSLQMERWVSTHHHAVRSVLDSLLRETISNRALASGTSPDSTPVHLTWLVQQYQRITSIQDMTHRLRWSSALDVRGATAKVRLDSSLIRLSNRTAQRSGQSQIEVLEALARDYWSIGDSAAFTSVLLTLADKTLYRVPVDSSMQLLDVAERICRAIDLGEILGDVSFVKSKILAEMKGDYFASLAGSYEGIASFERFSYRVRIPRLRLLAGRNYLLLGLSTQAVSQLRTVESEYATSRVKPADYLEMSDLALAGNYLAEAFYDLGVPDSALWRANQSILLCRQLAATRQPNYLPSLAWAHSTRGIIHQAMHNYRDAGADLEVAQRIFAESKDSESLASNYFRRAALLIDQSSLTQAEILLDSVVILSNDPQNRLFCQYGKALVKYLQDDKHSAKQLALGCIDTLESNRDLVLEPDLAVGYLSDKIGMYDLLVKIYLEQFETLSNQAHLDSALWALERSKSQSLVRVINRAESESKTTPSLALKHPNETVDDREIRSLKAVFRNSPADSLRIVQLNSNHGPGHKLDSDRESADSGVSPRSTTSPGHVFLEYYVSEFGAGVFVVATDTVFFMPFSISPDSLRLLCESFALAVSNYPLGSTPSNTIMECGAELGRTMIPFYFLKQENIRQLTIVPTFPLNSIPFCALLTESGKYLVEEFDLSTVPSIEVSRLLAPSSASSSSAVKVLAVGDPIIDSLTQQTAALYFGHFSELRPLNFAREEMLTIKSIFGSDDITTLSGSGADKQSLTSRVADDYSLIHFATHGLVNSENPEFSTLLLTANPALNQDGLLKAAEIAKLRLDGATVFLSACETASGTQYRGEGVYSLARSFLAAGAKEVIATLWNVDDRSTVDMTRAFYEVLHNQSSATNALAQAQRAMIQSPRRLYRHPYFWSPYVHIGGDTGSVE